MKLKIIVKLRGRLPSVLRDFNKFHFSWSLMGSSVSKLFFQLVHGKFFINPMALVFQSSFENTACGYQIGVLAFGDPVTSCHCFSECIILS